jgi:hypothetical protein
MLFKRTPAVFPVSDAIEVINYLIYIRLAFVADNPVPLAAVVRFNDEPLRKILE